MVRTTRRDSDGDFPSNNVLTLFLNGLFSKFQGGCMSLRSTEDMVCGLDITRANDAMLPPWMSDNDTRAGVEQASKERACEPLNWLRADRQAQLLEAAPFALAPESESFRCNSYQGDVSTPRASFQESREM